MDDGLLKGFTLIELIVTMAVAVVLLGVAVPSFVEVLKDGRISSGTTCLSLSLYAARSEAVKRSADVSVCPLGSANQCGSDWTNGVLVFTEGDTGTYAPTLDMATAAVDPGSVIVRSCPAFHEDFSITAVGSSDRTVGTAESREFIRFGRDGSSNWNLGYFAVCDDREATDWKGINVGLSGDIKPARMHADEDALTDAFSRKISACR